MAKSDPTMKPKKRVARKRTTTRADAPPVAGAEEDSSLVGMAKKVRSWSDSVLGIAGAAADVSIGAAKALYFPTISLTGALGLVSTDLAKLFGAPNGA